MCKLSLRTNFFECIAQTKLKLCNKTGNVYLNLYAGSKPAPFFVILQTLSVENSGNTE